MNALEHLMDSAHGIYTYHALAQNYPLFVSDGPITNDEHVPLADWLERRADMDGETIETVFHPDNDEWCENVDYCAFHNTLAVQAKDGKFWRVESIDGDLFAINPAAEYNEEEDTYTINGSTET